MRFKDLYRDSKHAVKETLTAMWCNDCHNESQEAYAKELQKMLDEILTPSYAMPLVQCMSSYQPIQSVTLNEANRFIDGLWKYNNKPYEHQYQCWKSLSEKTEDGKVKSIVVTTGTGSGKTECFMLPLIADLCRRRKESGSEEHSIQAIFLYPLNALMEDQKNRLHQVLKGTGLTFAVYNGNMPENDDTKDVSLHNRIAAEREDYPDTIVPTRTEMRREKVDILLTNPTMLEYMLLRDKDTSLFTEESLKWIVIDETHTYSGSAAAELAMLMRRVMLAFKVNSDSVRFATSSATIGNGEDEDNADMKLKDFICGITGQEKNQIDIIKGKRVDYQTPLGDKNAEECRKKLYQEEYLPLNELIVGNDLSIEERLDILDNYCDLGLKAKVHFFDKVLTQGLKVNLSEHSDGRFKIYTEVPLENDNSHPYLDLMRCTSCGEYIAVGQYGDSDTSKFSATTFSDNDMFDFSDHESMRKVVFALTKCNSIEKGIKSSFVNVNGDQMLDVASKPAEGEWHLIRNTGGECPCCGNKFSKNTKHKKEDTSETNNNVDFDYKAVTSFRLTTEFVSRIIAPEILKNLSKVEINQNDDNENVYYPHSGQQYISFVDSRQAAAQSTLNQNLEQERLWVYSRIFNELCQRKISRDRNKSLLDDIEKLKEKEQEYDNNRDEAAAYKTQKKWKELESKISGVKPDYITWREVFDLLIGSPECKYLCEQFTKRSKGSNEVDANGELTDEAKTKYVYAIMIELLARHPSSACSPETMGLFHSYYPRLDKKVVNLPQSVNDFNTLINDDSKKIGLDDWKNLLKIFLDYTVRSNMSLYLKDPEFPNFDIKTSYQRFATQKVPTRPVKFPNLRYRVDQEDNEDEALQGKIKSNPGNIIILLSSLIGDNFKDVAEQYENEFNAVLEDFRLALDRETIDGMDGGLLELETPNDTEERMNLMKLAFKLYDNVALCDTRHSSTSQKLPVYRPIDTLFKGYSPYLFEGKAIAPKEMSSWNVIYPFINGKKDGDVLVTPEEIDSWGENSRRMLWDNGLWGEFGCFANRYRKILSYPEILIQAEHTAQVDKLIAKQSQTQFTKQQLNILACSTTMEMGIDLGKLELVLLNSIPPHPANYKQRAGRSGRDLNSVRSACITLCGTDSIGLRTLRNPIKTLIDRKTEIPIVDLHSRQVIQRHVNSYLLRQSGVFNGIGTANNMDQQIIGFFTSYSFGTSAKSRGTDYEHILNRDGNQVYPSSGLGEPDDTRYNSFVNWVENDFVIDDDFKRLIKDTIYQDQVDKVLENTQAEISRCYNELYERVLAIGERYSSHIEEIRKNRKFKTDNELINHINTSKDGDAKYALSLKYMFSEILSQRLLPYLSTHRFTPNANMPVNIIEFDVNMNNVIKGNWNNDMPSNPSYTLQEALSQYAPGNAIILSNIVKVVRGLLTVGAFKDTNTFKKVLTDGNNVVIDGENENNLTTRLKWPVNGKEELELIQPYAFIPDINESDTRRYDRSAYTRVDAQLIGAGVWHTSETESHLISIRSSEETGDASILYYNDGIGYGYCYCPLCGKTVLEQGITNSTPYDFDNYSDTSEGDHGQLVNCHKNIRKLGTEKKPILCKSTSLRKVRRNVVIGNTIQTDYCEIKIRRSTTDNWIRDNKDKLSLTLAIIFTKLLAERLGIEEKDVSFTIMPNGNICIYDTNPGGSGYSKRLDDWALLNRIIDDAESLLDIIESKEEILDRYTMRYRDEIDIVQAKKWIKEEINCRAILPDIVAKYFPSAVESNFSSLVDDCSKGDNVDLFVTTSNEFVDWNYNEDTSWKSRISRFRDKSVISLNICCDLKDLPTPVKTMLNPASDWLGKRIYISEFSLPEGLHPLAFVDNKLYFTTQNVGAALNYNWFRQNVYCIQSNQFADSLNNRNPVSLEIVASPTLCKFILGNADRTISTMGLPKLIYEHQQSKCVIDNFMNYLNDLDNSKEITITYQDEHLKSCVGMVAAFQFVEYFVNLFGNNKAFKLSFKLEDYYKDGDERQLRITGDLPQRFRDSRLNQMIEEWNDHCNEIGLNGQATEATPYDSKELPHWRVFSFSCGEKQLNIYPNGGIINEWYLDKEKQTRYMTFENISCCDNINLIRNKEIMYDVEFKDA